MFNHCTQQTNQEDIPLVAAQQASHDASYESCGTIKLAFDK